MSQAEEDNLDIGVLKLNYAVRDMRGILAKYRGRKLNEEEWDNLYWELKESLGKDNL